MLCPKLHNYITKNREISRRVSTYLPTRKIDPFNDYEDTVTKVIKQIKNPLVLDIGGGKQCFLASHTDCDSRNICLDLQMRQLCANYDANYLIMGDALSIPLSDDCVDLVISRSFIEHVPSVETLFKETNRVLKKGGYLISVFPSKFAIFAIINQLFPEYLSKKALHHLVSTRDNELGFNAYYDKCYFTGINSLLNKNNYKVVDIKDYHFSSAYFEFFLPLFLISCIYEICTQPFKNLASYLLIIAKKELN